MTDLDDAIRAAAPRAFALLEKLVAEPSTLGQESGAQEVLAGELVRAGFAVDRLPIPEDIGADAAAGVPSRPYAGRYDVVGTRGAGEGPTLLINGHMDVVPADDATRWTSDPFTPSVVDGWLVGRGAGDMKAGFAAGMLALWALDEVAPGWLTGGLTLVSAIEEENTGNGTLAAGRAGYLAEAALLLEPTDLEILVAGIAITWIEIAIDGHAGHAEAALESVNPILAAIPIIEALRTFEAEMNASHASGIDADPVFAEHAHPYNVNIGTLHAGDWPSSVPSIARIGVRVGHPAGWTSEQALEQVRAVVDRVAIGDAWLTAHPPRLSMTGFRAERHAQEPSAELVTRLSAAHQDAHGSAPEQVSIGSTTDARFYLNQFGMPAVAYGPRTRNIHGTDEAVELESIIECARTVARFLAGWYAPEVS